MRARSAWYGPFDERTVRPDDRDAEQEQCNRDEQQCASTSFEGADRVVAPQGVQTGHGPADVVASSTLADDGSEGRDRRACDRLRSDSSLGVGVFRAVADERYDMIFDIGTTAASGAVQVGRAQRRRLLFAATPAGGTADGLLKRSYTERRDRCVRRVLRRARPLLLSFPSTGVDGPRQFSSDLRRPGTTKLGGVNWAKDFEFAATLGPPRGHSSAGRASGWQRRRSPVRARLAPLSSPFRRARRPRAARPAAAAPASRSGARARASDPSVRPISSSDFGSGSPFIP